MTDTHNEILYALSNDAVHALITEDQGIHAKAKSKGLGDRVYYIQTAEAWLRRLHEPGEVELPNIEEVELHTLTALLNGKFFDSLRDGYPGFESWFRRKAQEGRKAWIYRGENDGQLTAICIYSIQNDEVINDAGTMLKGSALKLCTFKVGETVRGRKIGELFLRAAFRYATDHHCNNIFIHGDPERHKHLIQLLEDFGFTESGTYNGDHVYVKRHPIKAPNNTKMSPCTYVRTYYPHYRSDSAIQKFIVPIQPRYHRILFTDYEKYGTPIRQNHFTAHVGNAMKLAYLSHAPTKMVREGDILLFYRTHDLKSLTTLGVVEHAEASQDASYIARLVSRRTVYVNKSPTKVMLFRLIKHFPQNVSYQWLKEERLVAGPIQSITRITNESFSRILGAACR